MDADLPVSGDVPSPSDKQYSSYSIISKQQIELRIFA